MTELLKLKVDLIDYQNSNSGIRDEYTAKLEEDILALTLQYGPFIITPDEYATKLLTNWKKQFNSDVQWRYIGDGVFRIIVDNKRLVNLDFIKKSLESLPNSVVYYTPNETYVTFKSFN